MKEAKEHAEQLRSTQPKRVQSVIVSEDMTIFAVNGVEYHIGQEVHVWSVLSQEMLIGILVSMDSVQAIVRAFNGTRFSFQYSLLKAGRIGISN